MPEEVCNQLGNSENRVSFVAKAHEISLGGDMVVIANSV